MRETLRQIVEAWDTQDFNHIDRTVDGLREVLAQPEQEPVTYCDIHCLPEPCVQCAREHEGYNTQTQPEQELALGGHDVFFPIGITRPTAEEVSRKPEQEPIAFIDMREWPPIRWRDGMVRADVAPFDGQGLFFTPTQRKPLTDEQHSAMWEAIRELGYTTKDQTSEILEIVSDRLAAHGIKGNGNV